MTSRTLAGAAATYDWIERRWESLATQRRVATLLVVVFLVGLIVIEANRRGWLPAGLAEHVQGGFGEARVDDQVAPGHPSGGDGPPGGGRDVRGA